MRLRKRSRRESLESRNLALNASQGLLRTHPRENGQTIVWTIDRRSSQPCYLLRTLRYLHRSLALNAAQGLLRTRPRENGQTIVWTIDRRSSQPRYLPRTLRYLHRNLALNAAQGLLRTRPWENGQTIVWTIDRRSSHLWGKTRASSWRSVCFFLNSRPCVTTPLPRLVNRRRAWDLVGQRNGRLIRS